MATDGAANGWGGWQGLLGDVVKTAGSVALEREAEKTKREIARADQRPIPGSAAAPAPAEPRAPIIQRQVSDFSFDPVKMALIGGGLLLAVVVLRSVLK